LPLIVAAVLERLGKDKKGDSARKGKSAVARRS